MNALDRCVPVLRRVARHVSDARKTYGLLAAIAGGFLVPQAYFLVFLVKYLIVFMLFFAFFDIDVRATIPPRDIAAILTANVAIPLAVYLCVRPFSGYLALAGFMTAISPTATAAPVVIGFLGGRVGYVAAAVLLTNVAIALLLPFLLTLTGITPGHPTWLSVGAVLLVVFVPLLASQTLRRTVPGAAAVLRRFATLPFYAWLAVLFLATSSASHFIRTSFTGSWLQLMGIALLSLVICVANFGIGYLIGGKGYARESSQALGQKNTMFTVWYSLAFMSPLIALGPTCYVIYHNLYNSYQMLGRSKGGTPLSEGT